ncbi:hypothetical protein CEXT_396111 [Caerostris extrusa]|uniref:Uncharacterized protein n=1 Tax=Caerostris extrusa TaxID=172846 RepID=A0AAV4MSM3_CAEEX|nr:hypothetical protein CEXT_396111 [Caerostris extrusa]
MMSRPRHLIFLDVGMYDSKCWEQTEDLSPVHSYREEKMALAEEFFHEYNVSSKRNSSGISNRWTNNPRSPSPANGLFGAISFLLYISCRHTAAR